MVCLWVREVGETLQGMLGATLVTYSVDWAALGAGPSGIVT